MMPTHFNKLLQRYLDKTASGDERNEFFKMVRSGEHDHDLDKNFIDLLTTESRNPVAKEEKAVLERVFHKMTGNEPPAEVHETRQPSAIRAHWWMAAAAVVLMTVVAWVWMIRQRVNADRVIVTGPEFVTFSDGSKVVLNEGSTLHYSKASYGRDFREITLEGEAYFDIQHDPSAPFLVHAGNVTTTVLGTAFNVNAFPNNKNIVVTVTRGKVEVSDDHDTFDQITPDQCITVNALTGEFVKTDVDARMALAWMNKYLILDRVTVEEAARLIEAKYHVKVTVTNDVLKKCTISAKFLKSEQLKQVLDVVSLPLGASYSIKDGNVSINGDGSNCN